MDNNNQPETSSKPPSGLQMPLWDDMRRTNGKSPMPNPFALSPEEELGRRKIAQHKNWLTSFPHECPSPYKHYRIDILRFDVPGIARKGLAHAIGEAIDAFPSYRAAPSFTYTIGEYTLNRQSVLTGPNNPSLLKVLAQEGYQTK